MLQSFQYGMLTFWGKLCELKIDLSTQYTFHIANGSKDNQKAKWEMSPQLTLDPDKATLTYDDICSKFYGVSLTIFFHFGTFEKGLYHFKWEYDISPSTDLPYANLPQSICHKQFAIQRARASTFVVMCARSPTRLGLVSPAGLG